MIKLISLALVVCFLQGCADVAVTGAQAVYNRHSIKKNFNDQYTTFKAYQALKKDKILFSETNIAIATFNGQVLLAGQTPASWQRNKAEQLIRRALDGKDEIFNLIIIANPSSSLTKMSDAWITAKVKSKLIASEDLDATQIKVVTENGTVYLMGILPPSEAKAAIELARETDGVSSVVKIFRYIHISRR